MHYSPIAPRPCTRIQAQSPANFMPDAPCPAGPRQACACARTRKRASEHLAREERLELNVGLVARVGDGGARRPRQRAAPHDGFAHLLKDGRRRALEGLAQPPLLLLHALTAVASFRP